MSAGPTRLDVFARHAVPWVGSVGALDMVNFGARDTVPERFRQRRFYQHNASVTLMRTTPDECQLIGEFLAAKCNAMRGPVRLLIPQGGVSAIDKPGQPFHDPEADAALIGALREGVDRGKVEVHEVDADVNDPAFATAMADRLHELIQEAA